MRRRLIVVDNALESIHRSQVLTTFEVVPTDFHLLARQMVAGKIEFELSIACVLTVGKTPHHIIERFQGLVRYLLVTTNIGNLDIIRDRLQIIGVSNVTVTRMQLDETIRSDDRLAII